MIMLTVDGTAGDGKPIQWTWTGKFDGKPYKVEGSSVVDSIATESVNSRTNSTTGMKDSKVVFTGTIEVAKDGQSRVVKTTLSDTTGASTLTRPTTTSSRFLDGQSHCVTKF